MSVYDLIARVGAEIVNNRAVAIIGDERVTVAIAGEKEMELTEAGKALAEAQKTEAPKRKRARSEAPAENTDEVMEDGER